MWGLLPWIWSLVYSISSPLLFTFYTNAPIVLNYTWVGSSFKNENLCCQTLDSAEIFCSGSHGYQVGHLIKVTLSIKSLEAGSSKIDLILFLPVCTQFQIIVKTSNDIFKSAARQDGQSILGWRLSSTNVYFLVNIVNMFWSSSIHKLGQTSSYLTRIWVIYNQFECSQLLCGKLPARLLLLVSFHPSKIVSCPPGLQFFVCFPGF